MHNDESVSNYFLRVDEIVNCIKNLGEEVKEVVVVEKVLRSLSPKFESKVSVVEEKENLRNLTMSQLHGILTAYEMRKGGPSDRREAAFKASGKGDYYESGHLSEEDEESNFVKNLQRGAGRFKGKLPFKCFACGRVGHYVAKCPHKDKLDKSKEPVRWNKKQNVNKKSYYTHEDSDGLSNSDEDEQGNNYRLLMAFEDDDFMDAIDEEGLYEKISRLKICLEEKNVIIDTLQFQLAEKKKLHEKLECEIVGLRKEIDKTKALNLRFVKGSETLHEIINVKCSPLIKTSLGYNEEASQAQNHPPPKVILMQQGGVSKGQIKITRSRFRQTTQKEQASSVKTWRRKEPQPERCGIALYAEGQENQWYIDSGCSKHMTGDKEKLQSYSALEKEKVSFGNDTPALIKGKGSVQLKEKVKAGNVMYVDGLKHNLLSVSQMCDQGTEFGKKTRTNFPKKEGSASRPLELVHTDVCGPSRKRSPRGEEYFILFIDEFSRMCWIGLMKHKDEAFEKFKSFKALVENESDHKIKCLKSDRGGEFTSNEFFDFCEEHGIRREFSTAKTPQQNGVVKRMNRTVQQMARAMLDESGTPATFWVEVAFAVVVILNKTNVRVNRTQTPHELWYRETPSVKYFKIFGSKCYIKNNDENIGKFEPRADEGILLGYSPHSKAYKCYNKRLGRIVDNIDVVVDEKENTPRQVRSEDFEDDEDYPSPSNQIHDQEETHEALEEQIRIEEKTPSRYVQKNHPESQILGQKEAGIQTRRTIAEASSYMALLSSTEPQNVREACKDECWVKAMDEELE
eukprot:PITA_33589